MNYLFVFLFSLPQGGNVSLLCRANSMPEPEITWIYRGKIISNSSSYANFQQQQATGVDHQSIARQQEGGPQAMYSIQETSASVGQTQKTSRLEILYLDEGTNGTFVCRAENRAGVAEANFTLYVKMESLPEPKRETRTLILFEWQHYAAIGGALGFALVVLVAMICCLVCACRKPPKRSREKKIKKADVEVSLDEGVSSNGKQMQVTSGSNGGIICQQQSNGSVGTNVVYDLHSPSNPMMPTYGGAGTKNYKLYLFEN
jgi:hypothetical protein